MSIPFDSDRAVARLMRFLAVEGITGQEQAIGLEVARTLREIGIPAKAIHFDKANEKIPLPTQTGNLIVTLPGTRPGPRRLFSTHLDTVPLCAGAVPVRSGQRIVPQGKTALGGDNRTGVACLTTMIAELYAQKLPHGPLTVLYTVARGIRPVGGPQRRPGRAGPTGDGLQRRRRLAAEDHPRRCRGRPLGSGDFR